MKEINMTQRLYHVCRTNSSQWKWLNWRRDQQRPELVNYLPEKYITSEILDSIFKQMITDGVPRFLKTSKKNVTARFV